MQINQFKKHSNSKTANKLNHTYSTDKVSIYTSNLTRFYQDRVIRKWKFFSNLLLTRLSNTMYRDLCSELTYFNTDLCRHRYLIQCTRHVFGRTQVGLIHCWGKPKKNELFFFNSSSLVLESTNKTRGLLTRCHWSDMSTWVLFLLVIQHYVGPIERVSLEQNIHYDYPHQRQ